MDRTALARVVAAVGLGTVPRRVDGWVEQRREPRKGERCEHQPGVTERDVVVAGVSGKEVDDDSSEPRGD
jgi:hypothetical protein